MQVFCGDSLGPIRQRRSHIGIETLHQVADRQGAVAHTQAACQCQGVFNRAAGTPGARHQKGCDLICSQRSNTLAFNPLPFVTGEKGAAQCLASQPGGKGRFWLIPRDSGRFAGQKPRILEAPDGFVFHHLNAFEDGSDHVVVESIVYDDFPSIGPDVDFAEIDFNTVPEGLLHRCRLDLVSGSVQTDRISERTCEFAMVNPDVQGSAARYAWMAVTERESGNDPLQAIQKLDLNSGESRVWSAAPRGFVSEPLMVRRPGGGHEDDGWVLDLVWNGARAASDLVILDAHDLSEITVLELPLAVPHGLHGSWAEQR